VQHNVQGTGREGGGEREGGTAKCVLVTPRRHGSLNQKGDLTFAKKHEVWGLQSSTQQCSPTPRPGRTRRSRGQGVKAPLSGVTYCDPGEKAARSPSLPNIYAGRLSCRTSEGWLGQGRLFSRTGFCVNSFGVILCDGKGYMYGLGGALRTPPRQRSPPPGPLWVFAAPPPRRSARRLQTYMEAKKRLGPTEAQTQPPSVEPQSEGVVSVEPDVCADAAMVDVPSPAVSK
jgi:hypothetical protein